MRLWYSPRSPFARIVRVALLETGLDALVTKQELTREQLYAEDSALLLVNPIGRVPTFELDDGTILTESALILDYIDSFSPGVRMLPRDGSDGWRTLAEMGQALGLLEGVTTWLRVLSLPEAQRAYAVIERESLRLDRAANALEDAVGGGAYRGQHIAPHIALGTALGVAENRIPAWKWREGRPRLSSWYDECAARPSFRATEPPS